MVTTQSQHAPVNIDEDLLQMQQISQEELRARILQALNDTKFSARTVQGISAEAHVKANEVIGAILSDSELANSVKIVPVRTSDGQALLTTKDRFTNEASFKEKFIDFFATKRVTLGE